MGMKKDLAKARQLLVASKRTSGTADEQLTDALDGVKAADKVIAAALTSFEAKKKKKVVTLLKRAKAQLEIFKDWIGSAPEESYPDAAFWKQVNDVKKAVNSIKGEVKREN